MTNIIQNEDSSPFQDKKYFVHIEMPMDRNSSPPHDLLGSHGDPLGTRRRAYIDKYVAPVTKVDEMLALSRAERITRMR